MPLFIFPLNFFPLSFGFQSQQVIDVVTRDLTELSHAVVSDAGSFVSAISEVDDGSQSLTCGPEAAEAGSCKQLPDELFLSTPRDTEFLEWKGYQVKAFSSGRDAVDWLESSSEPLDAAVVGAGGVAPSKRADQAYYFGLMHVSVCPSVQRWL